MSCWNWKYADPLTTFLVCRSSIFYISGESKWEWHPGGLSWSCPSVLLCNFLGAAQCTSVTHLSLHLTISRYIHLNFRYFKIPTQQTISRQICWNLQLFQLNIIGLGLYLVELCLYVASKSKLKTIWQNPNPRQDLIT